MKGMPNPSEINRLRIFSTDLTTTASNQFDVRLLTDPAAYRAAEAVATGSGEQYVIYAMNDETSQSGPNVAFVSDRRFNPPISWEDDLGTSELHLQILTEGAGTSHARFSVEAWADGLPELWPTQHQDNHTTHRETQPRVLRWSTGNAWVDLTPDARNSLEISTAALSLFPAATDRVYFGMEETWDGLWFNVQSRNSTTGVTLVGEYWDGTTWQTLTLLDNCTDGNSVDATVFSHSGVIRWDSSALTTWAKDTPDNFSLGTPPIEYPGTFASAYDSRYWVRFYVDDVTTPPTFQWIRHRPIFESVTFD